MAKNKTKLGNDFHEKYEKLDSDKEMHTFSTFETEDTENEKSEESLKCGYFGCKPDWLQAFNRPEALLVCLCWFMFTQCFILRGIIYVNLTAWEKLYGLHSTQVAILIGIYDICAAIFNLIYGYIGRFLHSGKILANGALMFAVGSLIMLSVHFLSDPYELGKLEIEMCNIQANESKSECTPRETTNLYWMFILGQVFFAAGGTVSFTIAAPYIDSQLSPRDTPFYLGIMQAFEALGPAAGYIVGGLFLKVYVDYGRIEDDVSIEPADPRWVGAWWIGFAFSAVASLLAAALFACFPRQLSTAKLYKEERNREKHTSERLNQSASENDSSVATSLKAIWTNPVWVCVMILQVTEGGLIIALAAFMPKFVENQFSQTPAMSAVITGAVLIPGALVGKLLGGFLPKCLDLKIRGLLLQSLAATLCGFLVSFAFLFECPTPEIAGVTVSYMNSSISSDVELEHACNAGCDCSTLSYDPICGADGVGYFSPCYAGCTAYSSSNHGKTYYDCSCISVNTSSAESGSCAADCPVFYPFAFIFCLFIITFFIADTSANGATIRSLGEHDRSLAFGIQCSIRCIIGHAPKIYLLGFIFDKACLQWQNPCGSEELCWIYDSRVMALGLLGVCLAVKTVSAILYFIALLLYRAPNESVVSGSPYQSLEMSVNKDTR